MKANELAAHMTKATLDERARCAAIVRAAREGDVDQDIRSIIHMIEGGKTVDDLTAQAVS